MPRAGEERHEDGLEGEVYVRTYTSKRRFTKKMFDQLESKPKKPRNYSRPCPRNLETISELYH